MLISSGGGCKQWKTQEWNISFKWNLISIAFYFTYFLSHKNEVTNLGCHNAGNSRYNMYTFPMQGVTVFSCDQAALRTLLSVRLSVHLSVCHTFFTMFLSSYHHEFSEVITIDKSDVHAKSQGQRSKVKVTEVTTQLNRFRTVTPVWIHIWW